jgi:hypothetical protein
VTSVTVTGKALVPVSTRERTLAVTAASSGDVVRIGSVRAQPVPGSRLGEVMIPRVTAVNTGGGTGAVAAVFPRKHAR